MDTKKQDHFTKANQSLISLPLLSENFKYFLLFVFITLFFSSNEQLEIKIVIKGKENQNYINSDFYLDPSEVIVNGVTKPSCKKSCSVEEDLNYVTIKFNRLLTSCKSMFEGISNIIEIDLSNLDTSKVTNMEKMFSQCIDLKTINFGDINTTLAESMHELFYNCSLLTSVNLSNFDTSSVTNMASMFSRCESLKFINASSFNTQKVENMFDLFAYCHNLTSVDVSSFKTANVKNFQGIFYQCYEIKYLNLSNFDTSSATNMMYMFSIMKSLRYININSFQIKDDAQITPLFSSNPPYLSICLNISNTMIKLNELQSKFYCNDLCFNENIFIELKSNRCVKNCNESEYKYEYNNFCYEECPDETFAIEKEYLCLSEIPEGYYLDSDDSFYKKCFISCKTCYEPGDEVNNNCVECKPGYMDLNISNNIFPDEDNINGYKNCYSKCPYYFYINNGTNITFCTLNNKCPEKYNKIIYEKNQCVNECNENDVYKYEFRNGCYDICPEGSVSKENNALIDKYYCRPICNKEYPFEEILIQQCVSYCSLKELKQKTCILNYKSDEEGISAEDLILHNIEKGFTSEDYDTSNLDKGEDVIFDYETMTITLTTTQNQKNNKNNNMTVVDLGECEDLLRKQYNISDNERLYMKKIDVIQEGMRIPKVEYDVYSKLNGSNLQKLNLTVCDNTKISLFIPVLITENLDILDTNSDYYNDICYPSSSDSGADIILKDRQIEFAEGNKTICQDDCDFSTYDYDLKKVKCLCKVKESSSYYNDMKINVTKIFENFIDIKNKINLKIMKCYKVLFSKKGIISNMASYLIISIIIFHIVVIILFYISQKRILDKKLQDITFALSNWELVKADKKKKKLIKRNHNSEKILKLDSDINIVNNSTNRKVKKGKTEKKIKIIASNFSFNSKKTKNKDNPPIKNRHRIKINATNNSNNVNNFIFSKKEENTKTIINKEVNNEEIVTKAKKIMEFDDFEKNNLSYKLALKHDKRKFVQYYISLLKTKQLFMFSFINKNDYNSRIIKMDLFFACFTVYYAVNALFFSDSTMHKIYEDKGKFNFIYQIPQIIYSSLISAFFNFLLKLFALTERNILNYKQNKNKKNLLEKLAKLNRFLKIKFILYFVISSIFLLFFWYYLSIFGAVYKNTQFHLIGDTLISFGISLIYPFGLYLLPGLFRIPALFIRKNKGLLLYNISKILQMI